MIHHRCKRIRLKKSDSEKTIIKNRADLISIDNVAELPEASFISAARSGHVLISSFSKFIILKGSVIIAEAWFAIPSACRMLSISVLDNILHLHLIVAQNNLISYRFDLISKSLQNRLNKVSKSRISCVDIFIWTTTPFYWQELWKLAYYIVRDRLKGGT